MSAEILRWVDKLVLGTEQHQRLRLSRTLLAAVLFAFGLAVEWFGVPLGLTESEGAWLLTTVILSGITASYVAIRSGWSKRFSDPALTLQQMQFSIAVVAFAYVFSHLRDALLMVMALVLIFGAFILSPRRCRNLGWLAVALLGCAMLAGVFLTPERFNPVIECVTFACAAVALSSVARLAGQLSQLRLDQHLQKAELRQALADLAILATRDELTGLPNRRCFSEWFEREAARSRRSGDPIALVILDLDHFKHINDTLGHVAGDVVLAHFAKGARECLRDSDLLARWGGEEFLLAMPNASLEDAAEALTRLRAHMAPKAFWDPCGTGPVTFSAGVTDYRPAESVVQTVGRADSAMYEAKVSGRDRFVIHRGSDSIATGVAQIASGKAGLSDRALKNGRQAMALSD